MSLTLLRCETLQDYFFHFLEPSDITKYTPPTAPECAIQVAAESDRYIPGTGVHVHEHWKGSELRWVSGGHVSSFVIPTALNAFKRAALDAMWRLHLHMYEGRRDELGQHVFPEHA